MRNSCNLGMNAQNLLPKDESLWRRHKNNIIPTLLITNETIIIKQDSIFVKKVLLLLEWLPSINIMILNGIKRNRHTIEYRSSVKFEVFLSLIKLKNSFCMCPLWKFNAQFNWIEGWYEEIMLCIQVIENEIHIKHIHYTWVRGTFFSPPRKFDNLYWCCTKVCLATFEYQSWNFAYQHISFAHSFFCCVTPR